MDKYDQNEITLVHNRLREIERAPIADRREGRACWLDTMHNDPGRVGKRVGWILDGHYGHGEMLIARQIVSRPRMNRIAALAHLVAAFDHSCDNAGSRAAWNSLTKAQQAKVDREIAKAIAEYERKLSNDE